VLERVGAARLVADASLTAERLASELDMLLADPERLAKMSRAARSVARPGAAAAVATLVEEHARG
jgi:UDP-N-acetylglucosamine--N-acetylmuramyl-(pentapeptide) pyrophosphoryl-undecaprenol N-acetylglucosamine transferase